MHFRQSHWKKLVRGAIMFVIRHVSIFTHSVLMLCRETLLVIRFMADLLRKYRGSVVIMVGRGGAEPHYFHN